MERRFTPRVHRRGKQIDEADDDDEICFVKSMELEEIERELFQIKK